jgi:hypothetical protein
MNEVLTHQKIRGVIGVFYENISQGLYGGELHSERYALPENNGLDLFTQPDLVIDAEGIIKESKGNLSGHTCELRRQQIDGYRFIHSQDPDKDLFFALYRHGVRHPKGLTANGVIKALAQETYFSLVLPFRTVVLRLYDPSLHRVQGLSSKSEANPGNTSLHSPTINSLLGEPEVVLDKIGLDQSDFLIERYESSPIFSINGIDIKPFLILKISEKFPCSEEEIRADYERGIERDAIADEDEFEDSDLDEDLPF